MFPTSGRSRPSSTSSTRPCATVPSRRGSTSRWPTSWRSPRCSTSWASTSSRAAGRAPTPTTPRSSPPWPTARCALQHAELVSFGFTRRVGMKAADDPLTAALRDSRAPVACIVAKSHDRHVEQALRTTLAREPGHDPRHGRAPAGRGPAGLRRLRALLRRLPGEPGVRAGGRARPPPRPAPRSSCSATPTAACCRRGSARSSPPRPRARCPARHPRPQRHRLRGGQHPGRGRRRCDARAGHRQRVRRAHRQRRARSRSWPTSSSSTAGRCCRPGRCARRPGSRMRSPR